MTALAFQKFLLSQTQRASYVGVLRLRTLTARLLLRLGHRFLRHRGRLCNRRRLWRRALLLRVLDPEGASTKMSWH